MSPIVIIGSGLAGYSLAREFRKLDATTPLTIITADDGRAYSKPMLSNALTQGKEASALASADAEKMAAQFNARIITGQTVQAIEPKQQRIVLNNETLAYRQLVLAVGATPFRADIDGDSDAILSVNNLRDYEIFRAQLQGKKRVALLGAGLIGSEFANDLANAGLLVDVIDRNAWPLGQLVPQQIGQALQSALQKLGVTFHFNTSLKRIDKTNNGFSYNWRAAKCCTATWCSLPSACAPIPSWHNTLDWTQIAALSSTIFYKPQTNIFLHWVTVPKLMEKCCPLYCH